MGAGFSIYGGGMPTARDKEFMAKLKELEVHCITWISAFEGNYVDVGDPSLHWAKDLIPYLHSLSQGFEAAGDFVTFTGARVPDDRRMINLLEDNVCGQADYMEFLETYTFSGRNSDLVAARDNIKRVAGDLQTFDSTIDWGDQSWLFQ